MDFEDILQDVGGFGLFQKVFILVFLIPTSTIIPWFYLNTTFMTMTPDHWCYVAEVVTSNISLQLKNLIIRPNQDPKCSMYDVNYSQILKYGNWNVNTDWPTKKCINGYVYDDTKYDETASTRWNMVCDNAHYSSLFVSSVFIGLMIGTPLFGYLADRCGRKPAFLIQAGIIAVTDIGSVLSPNFAFLFVLRAIYGSAVATLYSISYILVLELVNPQMRVRTNALAMNMWSIGLCVLPLIVWWTRNWKYLSVVTSGAAASFLLYWKWLPESPRWLIAQGMYTEAEAIMTKISKMNGTEAHETGAIPSKIKMLGEKNKKKQNKYSPVDLFRYSQLRKRFLFITICWVGGNVPYYGLQMNIGNLSGNEFLNFFYVSLVELPAHLATWILMERIGRRWCSMATFVITAVSCLIPVFVSSDDGLVEIIASLLAKVGSSSTFMVLYQQAPEIFPTPLRAMALAMVCTVGTGSTLIAPYIIYTDRYGKYIPFLIFSAISIVSGFIALLLPETFNKKLPQTIADVENFQDHDRGSLDQSIIALSPNSQKS